MQYRNSLLLLGLSAISAVMAQEFDNNDVPGECRSVCQSMVDAARNCDNTVNGGDRQEVDCICNTNGASTQLPECAACIRQFTNDDDDQNDVDEVVSSCGFSSTTFNAGAAGATSSSGSGTITSSASMSMITSTFTTTSTDIDDDGDDDDNDTDTLTRTTVFPADATTTNAAGSASNAAGSVTSSAAGGVGAATSNANDAANSATSAAGSVTDSGAVATALPMLGAGAGALAAVFGLL